MATAEALRDDKSATGSWPEGLPRNAAELGQQLDAMQQSFHRSHNGDIPMEVQQTADEVRKLLFASEQFPVDIARPLAADLATLRRFCAEQGSLA